MLIHVLEAATEPHVSPYVYGGIALGALLVALGFVVMMGLGRPNTRD